MHLSPILRKIHDKVTQRMSESWFVEHILIAEVTDEDGAEYDCIYCTILRTAVLFSCIGLIFGLVIGLLL